MRSRDWSKISFLGAFFVSLERRMGTARRSFFFKTMYCFKYLWGVGVFMRCCFGMKMANKANKQHALAHVCTVMKNPMLCCRSLSSPFVLQLCA